MLSARGTCPSVVGGSAQLLPLPQFEFFAVLAAIMSGWAAVTHWVLYRRGAYRRRIGAVVADLAKAYGPITCLVPGDQDAIAVGTVHVHWLSYVPEPHAVFSVPIQRIAHLTVVDSGPKVMTFSLRLVSGMDTRVLSTVDVVQAHQLIQFMNSTGRAIEFLPV